MDSQIIEGKLKVTKKYGFENFFFGFDTFLTLGVEKFPLKINEAALGKRDFPNFIRTNKLFPSLLRVCHIYDIEITTN